jgi:hypothetical protein
MSQLPPGITTLPRPCAVMDSADRTHPSELLQVGEKLDEGLGCVITCPAQ